MLLAQRPRPPNLATLCRRGDVWKLATTGWSRVPIPTPRRSYVSSFRRCGTSSKCSEPTPHTHRIHPPTAERLGGGRKCKRRRGRCRARRLCQVSVRYTWRAAVTNQAPGARSVGVGAGESRGRFGLMMLRGMGRHKQQHSGGFDAARRLGASRQNRSSLCKTRKKTKNILRVARSGKNRAVGRAQTRASCSIHRRIPQTGTACTGR